MGLVAKAFQDIITFSRASAGTYVNSNGYITNSSVLNYLTYSNQADNAAWTKSNSFVQTNLLTYSEQFDNAAWVKVAASCSGANINATISPNGTVSADRIIDDAALSGHYVAESPVLAAGVATISVYAKADVRRRVMIRENSFLGGAGIFDLVSGTVVASLSTGTASIENVGNGWYRCSVVNPSLPGGATAFGIFVMPDTATVYADAVYTGTGTGLFIWGAQVVQGSVPGDYRATTSAALPVLYADYNGVVRARKLCEAATTSAHFAYAGNPGAGLYVLSEYFKAGERTRVALGNSFAGDYAVFDLSAGTVASAGSGTVSGGAIINLGNGWYRCSAICAPTGTWNPAVVTVATGTATSYTGDGSSGIYIADAQLNEGSTALAYYDTTASAYNAPRFDYDPVTLAAKGLLIEEQRTNYLIRSSEFDNSSWQNASPNFPTVTANAILSPDGTVNADLLTASTGGTACSARQVASTGTTGNFTGSVLLKAGTSTRSRVLIVDTTSGFTVIGDFQIAWAAGVASVFSTTSGTASIVASKDGWYRCVISASTASANAIMALAIFPDVVLGTNTVYAYGAQLEAGAFATSYMPTTTSQFTRAADVASVNTLSPWFNAAAGTLYAEFDSSGVDSSNQAHSAILGDDSVNNYVGLRATNAASDQRGMISIVGGVSQAAITISGYAGQVTKSATTIKQDDFVLYNNGVNIGSDVSGTVPAVTTLFIGRRATTNPSYLNGHLRRITYYPRRLTNAELQTLTTL